MFIISKAELEAQARSLFKRPRNRSGLGTPDFKIRPISAEWRLRGRRPSYASAVANVAYIWRDDTPIDDRGPMPASFRERRAELRDFGLILPASAPLWAGVGYKIWEEADAAAKATGELTAVAAWHILAQIPTDIPWRWWTWLVRGFIVRELSSRGAVCAWAIHCLQAADGTWVMPPHVHMIVTARRWRHDRRQGQRHPAIASGPAQRRLDAVWERRCAAVGSFAKMSVSDQ